ncbi:LytR/AlgR family response regulator transcription factor [Tenacibaculum sp. M341]|uniref:LytR/AlgR family response regulator transcription factor n=1 Tax=Tenacibaculum sp. M341 TaxID=2530339 RepID=UPI0010537071|nr:LytTR family DNA-binding domain-containing protein [Tenacibaculum sp. M341]TCI85069.1 response regulator transcription factor [Tenacibaculum sp. M341]
MKCIIIEDDYNTVIVLKTIVNDHFKNIRVTGHASSVKKGIELIQNENPDFIFLDVNLDDGEGFEVLNSFPNPTFKIIFITSFSKYAVEAFKFSALDFVLKPFSPSEIVSAVNKVISSQNSINYLEKLATLYHNHTSSDKKIILSNSDDIHITSIDSIIYAMSDNSYTTVFTTDNEKILVSKSLKSFEEKLTPHLFFRIHQKFLINLKYIKRYHKKSDEIVLQNNISLPVAKSKKEQLLSFIKSL